MPSACIPSALSRARMLGLWLALVVSPSAVAADPPGLATRPATVPYLNMPAAPPVPNGSFTASVAFPHLTFQGAVAVRPVPGTNRLWVLEREGRIWSFEDDPSTTTKTLVLDLNDDDLDPGNDPLPTVGVPVPANDGHLTNGTRWWCQGWDDSGLMGIAFHPEFANPASPNRGRFYLCYQARNQAPAVGAAPVFRPDAVSWSNDIPGCYNRLSRFTVPDGSLQADPASELILVDQPDRHLWHNGGDLFFGTDGFLYLLNGDEGRADDHYERTQRVGGAFFGGVWRIDVDGPRTGISKAITNQPRKRNPADADELAPFTGNYGIPLDNPWVGLTGVLEEFWCVGLRSPHRMTIDPPTGRIFVGDIGQGAREEVDLIVKGGNYQWAYKEGHKNNRSDRQPPNYTVASLASFNDTTIAITNTATITGNGLSPGLIAVGDQVRFNNHSATYTVTAVGGYPHTSLTITPALTSNVPGGTSIWRTTGFRVTSVDANSTGSDTPNDYGSSQLTISGSGTLAVGTVVCFPGRGGSHQVIASSGSPTTSITIRPGFTASPAVTPPAANSTIDRLTVFGDEQPPLMDFARGGTFAFNAIIGGYVYRGALHPDLVGRYLLANNSSGVVYAIDPSVQPPTIERLFTMPSYDGGANGYRGLGGFGVDHDGEPLLCVMQASGQATNASTGRLWKIIRDSSTVIGTPIPTDLKDTGAFALDGNGTVTSMTPATSLIPYEVNAPLWSDAAHKRRWVAIPDGTTVGFSPTGTWEFPVGTVFVKHFELTVNEQTNTRRRLETRLLVRSPGDGVYGVTYKWNAGGTQATLVADAGVNETYTITGADGVSTRSQTWNYPSRNDCLSCHNANAGHILGVNTRQLNGPCNYPATGVTDNQVRAWAHVGLFDTPPAEAAIPSLPQLAHIADGGATPEKRVRSWIDSNCSHCHRPGGVHAFFDARFDTPLRQQKIVEGDAMIGLGLSNPKIIARGAVGSSVMHHRDNSLDSGIKMPPLAKNLVDTQAIGVMETWIASLPYSTTPVLGGLARTYNGAPQAVTATANTDGVPTITVRYEGLSVTYPSSTTPPTAAGTYTVTASLDTDLLYSGSTSGTLTIAPAGAMVAISGLTPTYNGSPRAVTVTTTPPGLPVTITYDGSATAPTNAGTYAVVATVTDPNHTGSASGSLVIAKAAATVTLQHLTQTIDGAPKPVSVMTVPGGLATTVTYDGGAIAPSAVGTYAVVATATGPNHSGSASGTLVLTDQPVLTLGDLAVAEGHSGSGNAVLTATLSLASTATITVDWTAGAGSATAGTDFTAVSGTLTFAPGAVSQTLSIPVLGDTLVETDETVLITLSDPQQVVLNGTTATLTILDDDPNTAPVIAEGSVIAAACDEDNTPTAFALTLHASDVDAGQTLTWTLASAPAHGTVGTLGSGTDQAISYTPTADRSGSDSFTVRVADGFGGSADCVVNVTIAPRNDAPVPGDAPVVTLTGSTATATAGTWSDAHDTAPGTITTTMQWQRADDAGGTGLVDIAGATSATYVPTLADRGRFLRVQVAASDDGEGLPAVASTTAHSAFIAIPDPGGSGAGGGAGSGGGGCGLGGSVTGLLGLALLLIRRQRLR